MENNNIKLMNIDEEVPREFFVFINSSNPVTKNNIELTGQFTSSGITEALISKEKLNEYLSGTMQYAPYVPNPIQNYSISLFSLSVTNEYSVEYEAEYIRKAYFPLYPSRFACIYAFGDYETCRKVAKLYNWDINTVKKFKLLYNPLNRVVKVNMEHVSLWRGIKSTYTSFDKKDIDNFWKSYWRGDKEIDVEIPHINLKDKNIISSGTIYEYLIEGTLKLIY